LIGFKEMLEYATAGVFLALALVAIAGWWRTGKSDSAAWAALAFGSLGLVLVQSIVYPHPPSGLERALIWVVALFPYFLYRFATSFSGMLPWIHRSGLALTGAVLLLSLMLPGITDDNNRSTGMLVFLVVFLTQWSSLSGIAMLRLWNHGRGQPTLVRRRMRTMSAAALGLNIALLTAAVQPQATGAEVALQLLPVASAICFYIGFAPPRFLRVLWRQPEREKLDQGVQRLMGAVTSDEVAGALLPHVAGMVGSHGAALVDEDGRVVAGFGKPVTGGDEIGALSPRGDRLESIELGDGSRTLRVWTSPYTSYFGPEEFALLKGIGALAQLALERSKLFERERDSRAAIEEANDELALANRELEREIGERKRVQDQLSAAREEAERANHAKSEFLSRMSHELRTPLNSILGFGQLLELSELDEKQQESTHYIMKAGSHLLDLINEILDISRIEAGTMTMSLEPTSARDVLEEVLDLMRPIADRQSVSLAAELGDGRDSIVTADRQRLKQVLLNLLGNAVKYNREDGHVGVALDRSSDWVTVEVRDSGLGIPADRMAQLFVPFDRLGAESSRVEGTGLGLSLSKRLIEVMGGEIGAESVENEGSLFWIKLPVARVLDETGGTPIPPAAELHSPPAHSVLSIEDNMANVTLLERVLSTREDIRFISAVEAEMGVELAREHHPNLILLDVHLPDMSGSDALRMLKRTSETSDIPVVVLSADATEGQKRRLMSAGATEYLTKPLDVARFLEILDEALGVKETVA
jgi:signal transduction histidine kinase/ActR/RegA family two-component response regulator